LLIELNLVFLDSHHILQRLLLGLLELAQKAAGAAAASTAGQGAKTWNAAHVNLL
jgi:hypothetical protein